MVDALQLRPARREDLELVFAWLNDPITRAMSLSTQPVPYADHQAWFTAALAAPTRHLFIAELAGEPVGFLRLDANEDSSERGCTISINLAPIARGRGLGSASLIRASDQAIALGFDYIDAIIRPQNRASVGAFARAGYVELTSPSGADTLHYRRRLG